MVVLFLIVGEFGVQELMVGDGCVCCAICDVEVVYVLVDVVDVVECPDLECVLVVTGEFCAVGLVDQFYFDEGWWCDDGLV